jgi:hypothetical protein
MYVAALLALSPLSISAQAAPRCDGPPSPEQVCVGAKALVTQNTGDSEGLTCRYVVTDINEEEGLPTTYCLKPAKGEDCKNKLERVSRVDFLLKVKTVGDASEGDQVWYTVGGYAHGNCGGSICELYEKGMSLIKSSPGQGCDWKTQWADLSQLL